MHGGIALVVVVLGLFDPFLKMRARISPDGGCFLAAWAVSKSAMSVTNHDRPKQNCQNGKVSTQSTDPEGLLIGKRPFQDGAMSGKAAFFRPHCQQVPKTHYSSAEYRKPYCKQDERSSLFCHTV